MAPGVFSSSFRDDFLVFISFRGFDVRYELIGFLYAALRRAGVRPLFDENFRRGKEIWPEIERAIGGAKMSIIVLSENFANSEWCLDEVVLIMQLHRAAAQIVIPVFFRLTKAVVEQQSGSFAGPFAIYDAEKPEKANTFRAALSNVVEISDGDRHVAPAIRPAEKVVDDIVLHVLEKMNLESLDADYKGLVGIKPRMLQVQHLLDAPSDGICIVSIWGMGGIGKSKLSECVYGSCCGQFDGFCALSNYKGVQLEQELSNMTSKGYKKVLILLDGVNKVQQIEFLADLCDKVKFGAESRIIVSTRNRQVFKGVGCEDFEVRTYEVPPLTSPEAHDLLRLVAFGGNSPSIDFDAVVEGVIKYAGGNPGALIELGKFLSTKPDARLWESKLKKLTRFPLPGVNSDLMTSFDELDSEERTIFLHVAFNFKRRGKEAVIAVLDACDLDAINGITSLVDRSLVLVDRYDRLSLHALHEAMATEIVRKDPTWTIENLR
ncbi:unnamed protein product [Linum tenue]|uniref:TIR domain-containing protein n=1 Tax=Linum tenue TaxID=586396 RepID=A0AAV0RI63_9ROSI|nr:unnamed protein product [Linum tenue]